MGKKTTLALLVAMVSLFLILMLAGCGTTSPPQPGNAASGTPGSADATLTRQAAEATAVALNVNIIRSEGTVQAAEATADVYRGLMTATAQQAAIEATAQAEYRSAEATARSAQVTQAAAATATQQAWMILGWTATADAALSTQTAVASATAYSWTQQAVDRQATADAASVMALATSQAAQAGIAQEAAEQERIRTERQDFIKYAWAVTPFVLAAAVLVLVTIALVNWANFKIIQRSADGNLPLIIIGKNKLVSGDRALDPITDIQNPRLPPPRDQRQITENDQKVQGIRALAAGGTQPNAARRMMQRLVQQPDTPDPTQLPTITVIDAATARPMISDVVPSIYRKTVIDQGEEEISS